MKKKTKRRILIALVLLTFIISSEQESLQKASTLAVSAEPNLRTVSGNDGSDGRGMIDAPEPDASNSDGENQDTDTPDAQEGNPGQGEGQSVDGGEQGDGTGIADGQGEAAEDGTDGVGIADPDSDDADAPMQENLAEEEEAEEQDGTIEQEELDYAGVQKGAASFGATVAELGAERTFYIKTYQDWLNLQALSRESSLEGYVFQINANNSVSTDYTEANHYNLSLLGSEFTGIGTESTPFQGTLKCYSSNNLTLMFGTQPLFNDLGGSASLENLKIQCTNTQSGLAKTLRGGGTLSMKNVFISGSVYNNTATANEGNAGGLFGVIDNQTDTPLTFYVQKETTTTQNGVAIGVSGNDKNNSTRLTIQGRICGTIAGTVRGNVDFVYDPATFTIAPTTTVAGTYTGGANGTIFGQMLGDAAGYTPAFRLSGDATFTPRVSASGTNGGLIGRGENMLLDTRGYTLTVDGSTNGNTVDVQGNSAVADGGCGGVIGWLKDSETTAETYIIVQNMSIQDSGVKNTGGIFGGTDNCVIGTNGSEDKGWQVLNAGIYGGNVGGLIGKYIAGNQDNTLKYVQSVNVLVQRNTNYTGQGGIIGYVKFDSDHSLSVDEWTVQGLYANSSNSADGYGTGGVAGKIEGVAAGGTLIVDHGTRISVSKSGVATNFTGTTHWLNDYYGALGSILGYCTNVDAELSNLYINGSYMQSYAYNGTLIGRIDNSSAIKHVYVKDITFERSTAEWTNYVKFNIGNANTISGFLFGLVGKNTIVKLDGSVDSSSVTWNYSTNRYLGKAAGVQEQALIYVEKDADYVPRSGVIDEIGNFGGIYQNDSWDGDGKLLIENDTLNGTVAKNGDGKYVLDSVGDLLRLSIALNTEGTFGTSCFGEDYEALLAGHYYVAGGEYDLTQTGMVSMQRNVGAGTDRTATPARFTGSFEGASKTNKAKITLATELYARQYQQGSPQYYGQTNQGLFINVGAPASDAPAYFANLELTADLQYQSQTENRVNATNVGGIAAYAYGNVTVQDCSVTLNTRSMYHSSEYKGYYGGVFGRYDAVSGSTLTVQDVEAGGDKYVYDKDLYTSQVIGYIEYQSYAVIPQIKFENITLSGQIVASRSDSWQVIGGLVAVINNSNATGNAAYNNFYNNGTYVKRGEMEIKNVTVRGMTVTDNTSTYKSGGLLGFRWTDTVITMSGIRVTGDASTQNTISGSRRFGALITEVAGRLDAKDISVDHLTVNVSNPIYPGLLVGEGRAMYLTLSDYRIDHDTTKIGLSNNFDEIVGINQASEGGSEESGGIVSIDTSSYPLVRHLKVGDASNAYKSYVNQATYNNGNTASNAVNNLRTRYYYDIPQILEAANDAGASLKDNKISTPEELLDWHLLNYAVSQLRPMFLLEIDKTINSNAATSVSSLVGRSYTIDGTIDLNGYSYYPTTISGKTFTGANNATIIFHAQEMIEGEDAVDVSGTAVQSKRYTYDSNKQHYLMHAGLFYDVTTSTIRNLTLKGTVSTMLSGSGALVVGTIWGSGASAEDRQHGYTYSTTAKTTIENIDLDNLWVSGSNANWAGNYGLMVRQIGRGSKVTFDSIRMQSYDADHPLNKKTNKKAAAALIGRVGANGDTETDSSAIEITVSFTNMDIADVADSVTVPGTNPDLRNSTEADKVLAYASFIYAYHYYEDTCGGVYTFYKADYLKGKGIAESEVTDGDPVSTGHEYSTGSDYVTMGLEIGTSVEFFDQSYTTPIGNDPYASEFGFDAANYKPYVYSYKTRQIAVNPKAGNIDEGCGTYEDPYVITNARQLKSVYYYLKDKKEQLTNWQVNEIGDDTERCTKTSHAIKTYGDADFPAKEKMNQAYYLFKGDIDFSGFSDFVGFGTNADPFLGVFVGDHANRKILLPNTSTNNAVLDSFALVRYAKGCVVKDLTIQLGSYDNRVHTDATVYTDYIKVTTAGGGVFAYVQGGDNIIDNVTVKGTLQIGVSTLDIHTGATVGGYAGQVQLGTLIVRNLSDDALKEFRVEKCSSVYMTDDDERKAVASAEDKEAGSYLWIGGAVGRVQDGVLLYDGSSDTATKVLDETYLQTNHMYTNTEGLEASPNFSMVNTTYLKSCVAGGNMKIAVYGSTLADKQITLQPQNDGQLYIAAMALNSGCFTYEGRKRASVTGTYYSGYDVDARYRNGNYSQVGVQSGNTARDDVIANDNINGAQGTDGEFFKPYLFDYVDFTADQKAAVLDGTKTDTPGSVSTLFTGLVSGSKDNYKTAAVRGAYHGIAAANNTNGIHANNFTIYLAEAALYDMSDYKDSFRGIGALYYTNANRFKGNLIGAVSGSAVPEVKLDMHMNNETATLNAGLLNSIIVNTQTDSCAIRNLTVSGEVNITTSNADDETTMSGVRDGKNSVLDKSAGGVIGLLSIPSNISPTSYANGANYYFENVSAKDLKVRSLEYAGGLLGKLALTLPDGNRYTVVKFKDCQVGEQGIGEAADEYNTDIKATADVGGLLGGYRHKLTMSFENCKAESVALETKGLNRYLYNGSTYYVIKPAAGGLIGRSFPREANSNSDYALTLNGCGFKKLNLKSIGHMGGAVGCNLANLTVTDFTGENIRFENTLSTESRRETSGENNDFMRYVGSFGGIVGYSATNSVSRTTITGAAIKDIAGTYHHGSYYSDDGRYETKTNIGGIAGALYSRAVLTDCTVGSTDTNIQIEAETVTASLSNDRVSVAGMVGRATGLTCTGCKVIGGNDSYLKGSDSAAGFAAYVYSSDSNADRTYYKNCSVQNLKLIANTKLGGMEAQRLGNAYSIFNGVTVKDCEFVRTETTTVITAAERSCGGLVAYTAGLTTVLGNGSADTGALVENVVTSGQTSDRVGGIVGYGAGNLSHVQGRYITVKNSTFIGRMAGLLAGSMRYNTGGGSEKKAEHITIENNKLIGYGINDNEYLYVGGLYGYGENFDYPFYGDDLTLKGNLIAGVHEGSNYRPNSYIGGLFGELNSRSFIENLSMEDNIISMLDYEGFRAAVEAKAAADDKTKSRVTTADYMAQGTFGIWNAGAVDAGKVESTVYAKLFKRTNALESYPALMTEAQLPDYAQRVGLLFGHHVSRHSLVTDLNLTYSPALRKYRPAVDVADNGATNLNNVFNYRSYYHIVYNDYEDVGMTVQTPTTSTAIKEAVENYTAPSGYTKSETYSFGQIEDIYKDYLAGVAGTKDARYTHHLEMNYKQQSSRTTDTAYSIGELYKYTYYDTESGKYQSPFVDGTGKVIPMAVFDISAVDDVNKWINTYVNLITNSGGTLNQNYGAAGLVTVTGHKMLLSDGVVSYLPGQNPCVTASGTTNSNTGLEFTVNSAGYDKQTNDTNGTFTLLHIEYTWNYPNTTLTRGNVTADTDTYTLSPQKHTIAIDVPVFLQKILEIDHHVTGIEGAEYYIENIYNKSSSNLNSSLQILQGMYTAYVEYDYSDAVEEYGSADYILSKEISFVQPQNETSYVQILKNTRITLIDIMDNNHVYYYTAETNRDSVKLSEFVDSASIDSGTLTYYKEPKISDIGFKSDLTYTLYHKHYMTERPDGTGVNYNANSRIAMQQYLVLVDTSKVNSNTEVSYAYKFRMNPCSAGYNGAADTDVVRNQTLLRRSLYPRGEDCSLLVTEIDGVKAKFTSNTAVTGEIAEGSKGLAIDIEYDVYANEAYWDYVNMLREEEKTEEFLDIAIYLKDTEGNRVSLPPGTNAIFNEESSVPVDNGAIIYFYKDSRLGDGKDRYSLLKVDGNRTVKGTLNLNFDTADFTEFQDGTYTIYLELLKTKERDFPMGGDRLDLFQSNLTTRTIRQLGFSLETKDLITLGMNGYLPQETDQGIIDFDMFIDFSDYVPKTIFSNRTAFEELAQKYFTVDYQVLRKQQRADGSYEYVPYTGDAVQVFWGDSASGMTQSGKTVVFKFSKNTMEKGNRGLSTLTSNDSVVTYPYTLKVDVDKLLERNDQITNYRLQGNIYISDTPPAGVTGMPAPENDVDAYQFASATPSGESLKDFIVFTIAKIKTDLDVTGTGKQN